MLITIVINTYVTVGLHREFLSTGECKIEWKFVNLTESQQLGKSIKEKKQMIKTEKKRMEEQQQLQLLLVKAVIHGHLDAVHQVGKVLRDLYRPKVTSPCDIDYFFELDFTLDEFKPYEMVSFCNDTMKYVRT